MRAVKPATAGGCVWLCHDCSFETSNIEEALAHPWVGADNFDHWLYEHPAGDRRARPLRDIHSSDAGGCYLSDVRDGDTLWRKRKPSQHSNPPTKG